MTRVTPALALPIALAISAATILSAGPSWADDAPTDDLTVSEFAEVLDDAADTNPVAAESVETFDRLSPEDQQTVVDIVSDPAFAVEFLEFATAADQSSATPRETVESSSLYPDAVEYESTVEVGDPNLLVGSTVASHTGAGRLVTYPANSTQTLTSSVSTSILGVVITKLNIWVTFRTGAQGIPKTALSSGSSATNYNFFIVITNHNLTPYVSQGLAVAQTVWTGSVLVKGSTFRFDKLHTLKAFSGGLYSTGLVNQ